MVSQHSLLTSQKLRCTKAMEGRAYVVGNTYAANPTNCGGSKIQLFIWLDKNGGHNFTPEEATQHFTPAP